MPIITLVAKPAGKGSVTADQIPDQVKKDIEELWEECQKPGNAGFEPRIEFSTGYKLTDTGGILQDDNGPVVDPDNPAEDPDLWLRQAVSYGRQRMAADGTSAALKIRALPKRNLPKHIKYITIARDIPADAAANTNKTPR